MYTVEFQADIQDGQIEIPKEYRETLPKSVSVVIIVLETASGTEDEIDYVEYLMENPLNDFTPLTREEIYERY